MYYTIHVLFVLDFFVSVSTTDETKACYQGWTWLSGQCYKVVQEMRTWEDANNICMTSHHGRLLQFKDIPQQTEVQTSFLTGSEFAYWIGLKANGTGWTWTDGTSNEHNSFSQQTDQDSDDGDCVVMNGRYWYKRSCNDTNHFVCQISAIECNRTVGWLLTNQHHCFKIEKQKQTWHSARQYCQENYAELVMLDDVREREFIKNLSISATIWIGFYYNDTVKSFMWVNGSTYQMNLVPGVTNQCAALSLSLLVHATSNPILSPCDRKLEFVCELETDMYNEPGTTTEYLPSSSDISSRTSTREIPTDTEVDKVTTDNYQNGTIETTISVHWAATTTDIIKFPKEFKSTFERHAYKIVHSLNISCTHNGMAKLLQSVLQSTTDINTKPEDKFQFLLKTLDAALESNTSSSLQKCFQNKTSAILIEPFIRESLEILNVTTNQQLSYNNLGYILDNIDPETLSLTEYHTGNIYVSNIEPHSTDREQMITLSIIAMNISGPNPFDSDNSSLLDTGDEKAVIGPILSLTAYANGNKISVKHTFKIKFPATYLQPFDDTNKSKKVDYQCVYLNERTSTWSDYGCKKNDGSNNHVTCTCNHTTNFAILMQITDFKLDDIHILVLDVISYIGCSISLLTQIITLTVFTCIGSLNSERVFVHRNLCIAIIGAQLVFLSGIKAIQYQIVCAIVAVLLHYCNTAVFVWMLVEGLLLYSKVVQVFGTEKSRVTYYCSFGWGVPVVIVVISACANWDGYGTDTSCWLSTKTGAIWAFVGPAVAIILVNVVILWMVIKIVISSAKHERRTEYNQIRAGVKGALILIPLLGLTWIFGLLAVNEELVIFQYLFAIFNSLQGFFIFLFHCVLNSEVRQALRRLREKQQLLKGDFSTLNSGSSHSSSSKQKGVPSFLLGPRRHNSNGTTSTQMDSRNSRSSKCSDDLVVQDFAEEDNLSLGYI